MAVRDVGDPVISVGGNGGAVEQGRDILEAWENALRVPEAFLGAEGAFAVDKAEDGALVYLAPVLVSLVVGESLEHLHSAEDNRARGAIAILHVARILVDMSSKEKGRVKLLIPGHGGLEGAFLGEIEAQYADGLVTVVALDAPLKVLVVKVVVGLAVRVAGTVQASGDNHLDTLGVLGGDEYRTRGLARVLGSHAPPKPDDELLDDVLAVRNKVGLVENSDLVFALAELLPDVAALLDASGQGFSAEEAHAAAERVE
mmetsp:Transcript_8501/g.27051  ORF Transcript_8501/g.27051 Transcript_8501/m.27051 type:complete len:258 (+) Transcript_8501:1850-2623(+)